MKPWSNERRSADPRDHRLRGGAPLATLLVATLSAVGCGARTGLWIPCTLEVRPAEPQVVVIADHSSFAAGSRGFTRPPVIAVSPPFSVTVREIDNEIGALESDPLSPTATGLYVYPEVGVDALMRDWVARRS